MTIDRKKLRWNGWGWAGLDLAGEGNDNPIWSFVAGELGIDQLPSTPAKKLEDIELPVCRLSTGQLGDLVTLIPQGCLKADDYERAFHARGKSYPDLLALRSGDLSMAPDAVIYPASSEEVLAVVKYCDNNNIALVPFGGGSSVVGSVNGIKHADQDALVCLDITLMDQILEIDEVSQTAKVQCGIYGPQLEEQLQKKGYTLGHFPQSFEFSTLGGWIAHRGAGQQSNKYGKADKWFVAARLATPNGFWSTENFPASSAGPQLKELVAGSEGKLGVIVEASVKLHKVPQAKDYRGYLFKSFEEGLVALREIIQTDIPISMGRISDVNETAQNLKMSAIGKTEKPAVVQLLEGELKDQGYDKPCLMLVGHEGSEIEVGRAAEQVIKTVKQHGGFALGNEVGDHWYQGRFGSPYLRDPLMDRGVGVDTLETATQWSNVLNLHQKTTQAIADSLRNNPGLPGGNGSVMAHVSHSYKNGCSLYFTYMFPISPTNPFEQWNNIKNEASDVLISNGGTISHHHGVGTDHKKWFRIEKGEIGLAALRAFIRSNDPNGTLNPGKLTD